MVCIVKEESNLAFKYTVTKLNGSTRVVMEGSVKVKSIGSTKFKTWLLQSSARLYELSKCISQRTRWS